MSNVLTIFKIVLKVHYDFFYEVAPQQICYNCMRYINWTDIKSK
jgi:hypothetical protein